MPRARRVIVTVRVPHPILCLVPLPVVALPVPALAVIAARHRGRSTIPAEPGVPAVAVLIVPPTILISRRSAIHFVLIVPLSAIVVPVPCERHRRGRRQYRCQSQCLNSKLLKHLFSLPLLQMCSAG